MHIYCLCMLVYQLKIFGAEISCRWRHLRIDAMSIYIWRICRDGADNLCDVWMGSSNSHLYRVFIKLFRSRSNFFNWFNWRKIANRKLSKHKACWKSFLNMQRLSITHRRAFIKNETNMFDSVAKFIDLWCLIIYVGRISVTCSSCSGYYHWRKKMSWN